jgi:hypothetical protein
MTSEKFPSAHGPELPEEEVDAALLQEDAEKAAAEQAQLYSVNDEGDVLPPELP